eukprot:jgi/Picsp_1/5236/NSC_02599-R1_hypothetical protein CHLNCDRAFT_136399 [Chlorella variabilis]
MVSDEVGKALEHGAEGGVRHPPTQAVLPGRKVGESTSGNNTKSNKSNYETESIKSDQARHVASKTMQRVRVEGNTEVATPFEAAQRDLASLKVKMDSKEEIEGSDSGNRMVYSGEGDDGLTDEELAWKLHKELNSGSPVFRTRSRRGTNSKERSNLAESALGVKAALEKQRSGEGKQGLERQGKRRGGQGRFNKGIGTLEKTVRKGKRAMAEFSAAEESGEDSKEGIDNGLQRLEPLVAKNRSPKFRVNEEALGSAEDTLAQKSSEEEVSEQKENNSFARRSRKGKHPRAAFAEGSAAAGTGAASQQEDSKGKNDQGKKKRKMKGPPKIPKLPMVQQGDHWFRARVLEESETEILVEFAGFELQMPSEWVPKYCERVWLGSYKGSDWKYQGQGAWVPKKGCFNRRINLADFGLEDPSDQSEGEKKQAPEGNEKTKIKRSNSITMVNTPSLQEDMSTTLEAEKRSQKRKIGSKVGADQKNSSARKYLRKTHRSSPGETERIAERSIEDAEEIKKKRRPRRATKSAAIYKNAELAVEADTESSDHDHLDAWTEPTHLDKKALNETSARPKESRHNRRKPVMKSEIDLDLAPSLEEQEALAALAEMPSSPLTIPVRPVPSEQYGHQGTSNGRLHSLKNEASDALRKRPGRRPKSDQKKKLEIGQSFASNSLAIAEQMFGGLLGAVSSRMSVAPAKRRMCQPSFLPHRSQCSRLMSWSPHIWSSGVYPANGQPAILTVPNSLIRQALGGRHFQETEYARERIVKPPVPLFC